MTTPIDELYRATIQKVHIVHDDTKQQAPTVKKRKEYVAIPNTYPLAVGANPVQILPHSPKRVRAEVVINGTGVVAFGKTLSDCQSAQSNAVGEQTGNVFVVNGTGFTTKFLTCGTTELWVALVSASSPSPVITQPTISQPAVPATGVNQQNLNNAPVTVVISANGATITNVTVNGQTVGTGAGTYIVPAAGTISIAYTVATPTWQWSLTPVPQTTSVIPTTISVLREVEQQ